jgi:Rieske Fe-S protein
MTSSRSSCVRPSHANTAPAISLRRFISLITRLAAAGIVGGAILPRASSVAAEGVAAGTDNSAGWLDIGASSSLAEDGPTAFAFICPTDASDSRPERNAVVFVSAAGTHGVQALSNVCPHQGCRVHWDDAQHLFACPCHQASFAADGHVLAGPSQAPLEQFAARVRDGRLQIKLSA